MMSDQESDKELDDLSWNPELQKIYADDSWAIENVEIDKEADDIAWKNTLAMKMLDYPKMLLDLYQDKEPETRLDSKYPKNSILSRAEMERYVKLKRTFKNTQSISELHRRDYKVFNDFKSLKSKILIEQEEYQRFLMGLSPTFIPTYNHVDPTVERWFESRMNIAAARVKKYRQLYVHLKDFGIVFVPFKNDSSPCPIENLVKHLGKKKPLANVSEKTKITNMVNDKAFSSNNPTQCWKKCAVSEDINAERLAIAWNADIVIGMSALKTLADNLPPYQAEWEIPVLVRMFGGLAFSKEHKIAFIDNPLPPRRVAPREKNQMYFKEIFKQLCHTKTTGPKRSAKKKSKNRKSAQYQNCPDDVVIQLDGANDDINDHDCGNNGNYYSTSIQNASEMNSCQHYTGESIQHVITSDFIMQVDGANDEPHNEKHSAVASNRKSSFAGPCSSSAWLKPRKPPGLRNLRAPSSDSGDVEPFSVKKSTRNWTQTEESKLDKSAQSASVIENAKSPQQPIAADTSAELSFRLLPESALSLPVNPTANKSKSSKKTAKNDVNDVGFTPRRSARTRTAKSDSNKSKICVASLVTPKGKTTTSPQRNLRRRGTKKVVMPASENTSSDDEPLIVTKKKNRQRQGSVDVNEAATGSHYSDGRKDEGPCSDATTNRSAISESDILGQILGAEPRAAPTIKDIPSVWASQAERMGKTDVDKSYSTNDLVLLQPDINDNVSYTLWKFGKKRVLIRYTLDGCLIPPKFPNTDKFSSATNSQNLTDVSLRTKLEYQSDYVFERLTQSEICRDYVTMLLKRPAKIVRAHIEPIKKEILDVEWTTSLYHFQEKASKVGYNPAVTSKLLLKLFEMIGDLEKGEYICTHRESEQKMSVRKSVDVAGKNVVYDLHKEYANPGRSVVYTNIAPWVPGDPQKLRTTTPGWPIIPLVFDPKDDSGPKVGSRKSQKK